MLLSRLELDTRAFHRDADEPWLALMPPGLTRARYGAQLARAYGFAVALERALAATPQLTSAVASRAHARLLARDLFALDHGELGKLPRPTIAPITTVPAACGWIYVIERSARLFPAIVQRIRGNLPQLAGACAYLDDTAADIRWRHLGTVFERIARTPPIAAQIAAAAHDAFRALTAWYTPENEALRAGA